MLRKTIFAFVGILGASAFSSLLVAAEEQKQYLPVQSISHGFGSKFISGYFVQEAATCFVTMMIMERSDPDAVLPFPPARIRLALQPGQAVGLDSEEGGSLNLACGEGASTMVLDIGERDRVVGLQSAGIGQ